MQKAVGSLLKTPDTTLSCPTFQEKGKILYWAYPIGSGILEEYRTELSCYVQEILKNTELSCPAFSQNFKNK